MVKKLTIDQLELANNNHFGRISLEDWLSNLINNDHVVVDAENSSHLITLSLAIRNLSCKKRFLFRAAASFINALAGLKSQIISSETLANLRIKSNSGLPLPGLIIVGSFSPLADIQLQKLFESSDCIGVELKLKTFQKIIDMEDRESLIMDLKNDLIVKIQSILLNQKTPVFFTSRGEVHFQSEEESICFGNNLAMFMAKTVAEIPVNLGYIISKGGITTNTLLSDGLSWKSLNLEGQLLPGLSVVTQINSNNLQGLPILTFPGNLGNQNTLLEAWRLMDSC